MSWTSRLTLVGVAALLGLSLVQAQIRIAAPQPPIGVRPGVKPPVKTGPADPGDLFGITLPTEEDLKRKFKEINVLIEAKDYAAAIDRLQGLLDRSDDVFAPVPRVGADGKLAETMVSVKAEAARIVGNLDKQGMDLYRLTYGPKAAEELKVAKAESDAKALAQIMARYLYTDAGAEATELLATYLLDRGQFSTSALCFERLFQRAGTKKLAPLSLFKAAIAFQHSGDKLNQERAWKELEDKSAGGLTLGTREVSLDDLKAFVARRKTESLLVERYDRIMFGGDSSRNAQGHGGTAFLDPRWKHPLTTDKTIEAHVKEARDYLDNHKRPVLHGFSPLAAMVNTDDGKMPLMIYRSFFGIHARALTRAPRLDPETKKPEWEAGEIYWEQPLKGSLEKLIKEPRTVGQVDSWLRSYVKSQANMQPVRPQILFENSVVGCLSTDNVNVYAIDDLQVPPPAAVNAVNQFGGRAPATNYPGDLGKMVRHNRLQAINLDSGKLIWEVGTVDGKGDLDETYFLGAPLPLNGKLYVLSEKEQELRLLCLDPVNGKLIGRPQKLGDLKDKLTTEITRRYTAAHLAYGEGILVCPTNSGGILGVDLLTNSLVWAYGYKDKAAEVVAQPVPGVPGGGPPGWVWNPSMGTWMPGPISSHWIASAPCISEGKVIFTAPDGNAIHCVTLRDGSRVWKNQRKEGDQYLAGVFAGKALVIGKNYARAISLADGTELFNVETGVPSGIGIASKDVYYLPLAQGAKSREPEICLLDMKAADPAGVVMAHTRSRKKEIPGNLLFYEGEVLSQSLSHVASYPQLEVELKTVDALLARNAADPEGLTRRGDLYLDKGELGSAIEDLRNALKHMTDKHPAELKDKAKAKLYESLTEYFHRDFDKAEKFLKDYEAMCSLVRPEMDDATKAAAAAEEKRRKGNFYCLLGRGREQQKKFKEAFEAYMNFGTLGSVDNEMMSVVDDPNVKASPRSWAEGRIANMVAKATKEELAPLEAMVTERWQKVQTATDVDTLRNFVNTFGFVSDVGRQARLHLAERLITSSDPKALVDAERHLSILRMQPGDPAMAARAVETMARLMTSKGLMDDAAYFYRVLARDHGKVPVRDGKTGQDIYNDLATDKRFLPYLDEPVLGISGQKMKASEFVETHNLATPYHLEHDGEKLPFFEISGKVVIRLDYNQLKFLNRDNNEELWSLNLNETRFDRVMPTNNPRNTSVQPRFSYQTLGHLLVVQVGTKVFAIDATNKVTPRLWEMNLAGSQAATVRVIPQYNTPDLTVDPRDGSTQVIYQDGWMQRLGRTGTLSPVAVPILTRDALQGVDPIRGEVLWVRGDMPKASHIFSDETHIYTIELAADGTTGATRVFRLHDGVTEKTRDFADAYRNRVKMFGRRLLTKEDDARGVTLRLYDIVDGKDLWKQTFVAGSLVLQPECDDLAGVVEPNGKTVIVDLKTLKTMTLKGWASDPKTHKMELTAEGMRPEHIPAGKVKSLHLLRDGKDLFIACNTQPENAPNIMNMMSNILPTSGINSLHVNGYLYSFDLKTGVQNWYGNAENQMLVLEEFEKLPVVMMTSRYYKMTDRFSGQQLYMVGLRSYDKLTGKLLADKEIPQTSVEYSRYANQFHTLKIDVRGGKVDLLSYNLRWSHHIETNDGKGAVGSLDRKPETPPTQPVFGGRSPATREVAPRAVVPIRD